MSDPSPEATAASEQQSASSAPATLVIAIDGPSGSGKSSTALGVASRLGLDFLDTGAMYRAMTWLVQESGLALTDTDAVAELVAAAKLELNLDPEAAMIAINGTDVTAAIREPRVSAAVSSVATNLAVRADLVARQQQIIAESGRGIVAEGRDITTVVAPDAAVRVLLVADPAARVARRKAELSGSVSHAEVTDQVIRRDRDDSTVAAFAEAAPGVTVVDSTYLSLSEVIDAIVALVPATATDADLPAAPTDDLPAAQTDADLVAAGCGRAHEAARR